MKYVLHVVLAALGLSLALSSADAANWERFRGPNGFGVSEDKDIPVRFDDKENVLWKLPLPGSGNSSPIVWGKHLFLQTTSADGKQRLLLCIDVTQGKELWAHGISAAPAGKIQKHPKNTLASATPVTDGASVFVPFWDGQDVFLAAYNFKGDLLWNKPLGHWVSQHGTGASPVRYRDKVIFCNDMDKESQQQEPVTRPSTLYAFDKKTGAIAWEVPREAYRACYSAPFLLEKPGAPTELIVTSTTSIMSYNPDDGAPNWRWNWKFKGKPLRTVAGTHFTDGMLFACAGDGDGSRHCSAIAINGAGKNARPAQIWENPKDFPYVPCILNHGHYLYFVNDGGVAGCFEAKTGKKVWDERIPGAAFTSSPVLIGDKVYAPSEDGNVHIFTATPAGFQPIATNHLGETLRASPAVADGRLYIRGQHHLFCIGKKPEPNSSAKPSAGEPKFEGKDRRRVYVLHSGLHTILSDPAKNIAAETLKEGLSKRGVADRDLVVLENPFATASWKNLFPVDSFAMFFDAVEPSSKVSREAYLRMHKALQAQSVGSNDEVVWIGHSAGGQIGVTMANMARNLWKYPDLAKQACAYQLDMVITLGTPVASDYLSPDVKLRTYYSGDDKVVRWVSKYGHLLAFPLGYRGRISKIPARLGENVLIRCFAGVEHPNWDIEARVLDRILGEVMADYQPPWHAQVPLSRWGMKLSELLCRALEEQCHISLEDPPR